MSWSVEPILEPPSRTLDAWMVMEVPFDGSELPWTRHLVGWNVESTKGRVSSPVAAIDPRRRRARTRSGGVYELRHGPGLNTEAFSTWCRWKSKHGLEQELDVSDDVAALLAPHSDY